MVFRSHCLSLRWKCSGRERSKVSCVFSRPVNTTNGQLDMEKLSARRSPFYFLKSFLSFSKYYVSPAFVSLLIVPSLADCMGSYTTWIWLGGADAVPAAAAAILCWCAQLSDVTLRDLISGGFLLLIDVENAKPRRRVALHRLSMASRKRREEKSGKKRKRVWWARWIN